MPTEVGTPNPHSPPRRKAWRFHLPVPLPGLTPPLPCPALKVLLFDFLRELRASYWFIPTVMALLSIALAVALTSLDGVLGADVLREIPFLYANQPDGARAVLSTIAGSMITVAGVTFSMTILTVSFAAGQIGPRLMNNFMRDRGNQITLGTFIATFLYCLMVLRTVRDADEAKVAAEAYGAFVPHLAILAGLFLALASVGVLIYFIHHVPESINVSHVVAGVGRDLNKMVDKQFPTRIGEPVPDNPDPSDEATEFHERYEDIAAVDSQDNGYIRAVDDETLMKLATKHDLVLRLEYRPGNFVNCGKTLLYVWPSERLDDKTRDKCRKAFAIGVERTRHQNVFFLIDELVEIIGRALSPGINDPFTAINCLDWLQSVLANLATRQVPDRRRFDDDGHVRVIAHPLGFEAVASRVFDQTLPYVAADRNASLRSLQVIAEVAVDLGAGPNREAMLGHATTLRDAAMTALDLDADRQAVDGRYQQLLRAVHDTPHRNRLRDAQGWLGGSA